MSSVEISCERIEPPERLEDLERFTKSVLERLELPNWELSIVLCDDAFIRRLNRDYRGRDEPTDVLSFPQQHEGDAPPIPSPELEAARESSGAPTAAGDIVISLPAVADNANELGVTFREELRRMVVHGILHLAGHTHPDNSPKRPMLRLQERILAELAEEQAL